MTNFFCDFEVFYMAARATLQGVNPYTVREFFYPLWTMMFLWPIALLPQSVATACWVIASVCAYWTVARRKIGPVGQCLPFILSYPVLNAILTGNCEWIVLLALLVPDAVGSTMILLIKPQVGIGLLAKRWLDVVRKRQWGTCGELVIVGAAFVLILALSNQLGLRGYSEIMSYAAKDNISMWLWTLPLGMCLWSYGYATNDDALCLGAGVLCIPYYTISSLLFLWLPIARHKWAWAFFAAQWIVVVMMKRGL